jgi:hypothetical protein
LDRTIYEYLGKNKRRSKAQSRNAIRKISVNQKFSCTAFAFAVLLQYSATHTKDTPMNYSVSKFTFNNGVYGVEASELGWKPGEYPRELGIIHRSGVVSKFVLCGVQHGPDNDLEHFEFENVVGKDKVIVFND